MPRVKVDDPVERGLLESAMTEDELQQAIVEAATYLGWLVYHVRRSDRAIVQGASGFPDLVLARDGVVWFLELKRRAGVVSPLQERWLTALTPRFGRGAAVHAEVVRPHDLDDVIVRLGGTFVGRRRTLSRSELEGHVPAAALDDPVVEP